MKNLIKKLTDSGIIQQAFRFVGVGIINTVTDFGIMYLLILLYRATLMPLLEPSAESVSVVAAMVAQTISFLTAATVGYFLNKYYTFNAGEQKHGPAVVRMFILSCCSFTLTQLGLWFFYEIVGIHPEMLAKLLATPLIVAMNFLVSKFWVFREKK